MPKIVFALGLLLSGILMAGSLALAEAIDSSRAKALTHLVKQDCGSCHGMTLKGGLGEPLLPADLAETEADHIVHVILEGVPGTAMPPWRGLLSEAEARWIADGLKAGTFK